MKNKKTIAFTIHSLNAGGSERVVCALANELIKHYNVKIICLENSKPFYELDPKIKLLSCELRVSKDQTKIASIKNHKNTVKKISTYIKNESIDLLIGFTTSVNVLSLMAAKLNRIPIIISERNNPVADPPNLLWKSLRNVFYRFAQALIVQTSSSKLFFSKIISPQKIIIIKNPIDPLLASKRKRESKSSSHKTILTVGRLDANKSQDLLLKAFAKIKDKHLWKLYIVGEGKNMEQYKTLAKQLQIDSYTHFEGNVSNIYDYYNHASIFVFTSKSEGYPNALSEALFFGIPCISTNCLFGPSDLITHEKNGILIDVDDQKMLEHQLKRLMADENLRAKLSNNAIEKSKKLNMRLISSLWIKQINKLI